MTDDQVKVARDKSSNAQEILLGAALVQDWALYQPIKWNPQNLVDDATARQALFELYANRVSFDTYCPSCRKASHFVAPGIQPAPIKMPEFGDFYRVFTCSRVKSHRLLVWLQFSSGSVQKIVAGGT